VRARSTNLLGRSGFGAKRQERLLDHHPHKADGRGISRLPAENGLPSPLFALGDPLDRADEIIPDLRNASLMPLILVSNLHAKASTCRRFLWWPFSMRTRKIPWRPSAPCFRRFGRPPAMWMAEPALYPDNLTDRMAKPISETERRRVIQQTYNETHGNHPLRAGKRGRQLDPLLSLSSAAAQR